MYISRRSATFRNVSISTVNGGITLIILLIAPLGLAAVIINTLLVAVSTYIVASAADRVILWLEPEQNGELTSSGEGEYRSRKKSYLQRW
ncbi:MAG: CRISPR-associated protein Csx18, partial [Nostocales cyanobacterium ELA608]